MKSPLILSLLILSTMSYGLLGCTYNADYARGKADEANRIEASCNSDSTKTIINGHTYFCDDYTHFSTVMQSIAKQLQQRGL